MHLVQYHDLNRISFQSAWDYHTIVQQKLLHKKLNFRGKSPNKDLCHLIICEHNPVYTLGKSGSLDHLLFSTQELDERGIEYYPINRGGDITYHDPGQLTVYPIFDLENFYKDVHRYVRELEMVVIDLLSKYGINGLHNEGYTGVWVKHEDESLHKVCAIGIHISKWVSLHGIALNVNTDLDYFEGIVPCGISESNRAVSSMSQLLGKPIDMERIKLELKESFAAVFKLEYI